MSEEIMDFMDLAKPFEFKVAGKGYFIPSPNKFQFEKLVECGQQMDSSRREKNEEGKDDEDESFDMTPLNLQQEYISIAVFCQGETDEKGQPKNVDIKTVEEWPLRVQSKIVDCINKQMNLGGEESEKK